MTLEEYKNEIKELKERLEKLEAVKVEEPQPKRWKPKDGQIYWLIDRYGNVEDTTWNADSYDTWQHLCGNCFETKEEAEKAVEKLKAWKRLKDKGFRFDGWEWRYEKIRYELDFTALSEEGEKEAEKDLDLLFGGDDEVNY